MIEVALADGGRLSTSVFGDGPPVLLLRPLGGSLASWGRFADVLASRLRVVAFDPRGIGCSSPAPWRTTTRTMAADAVAVLDRLGIDRADVYGISLGGMVACRLALDHPGRIARLVLASTAASGRAVHAGSARHALALAACLWRPAREAEACLARRILSPRFVAAHPDQVADVMRRARERPASRAGLVALLAAALVHDVARRLHEIRADTLVVAGGADAFVPASAQRRLAAHLASGRCVVLPGVGHDLSVEAPDAAAALVIDHVLRDPAPPSRARG
jgi:pimeloyl-ACP methyl ester carboxylesterase